MDYPAHKTAQRNHTRHAWFCPSSFTGKERDEETGYGYFGARYMDFELTTMWLSVDPMADKYPSISPYAYCAWNPVKMVDPSGEIPRFPFWFRAAVSSNVHEAFAYRMKNGGELSVWESRRGFVFASVSANTIDESGVTISEKMFRPKGYSEQAAVDKTNNFWVALEMWFDEPSGSFPESIFKITTSTMYDFINKPVQFVTGTSMAGTEAGSMDKLDGFLDIMTLGFGRIRDAVGAVVLKSKNIANFAPYEEFILKTGGRKGRRSKDIGRAYRLNKDIQKTTDDARIGISHTKDLSVVSDQE